MTRRGLFAAAAVAEDEERGGEDALIDWAKGGEAGGDDVVGGFVDGPYGPD